MPIGRHKLNTLQSLINGYTICPWGKKMKLKCQVIRLTIYKI